MRASRSSRFTWTWGTEEGLSVIDVSPRHPHPSHTATIADHSSHPSVSYGSERFGARTAQEFQAYSSLL